MCCRFSEGVRLPVSVKQTLLLGEPSPCNPSAEIAIQPLIWRFKNLYFYACSSPEDFFSQAPVWQAVESASFFPDVNTPRLAGPSVMAKGRAAEPRTYVYVRVRVCVYISLSLSLSLSLSRSLYIYIYIYVHIHTYISLSLSLSL